MNSNNQPDAGRDMGEGSSSTAGTFTIDQIYQQIMSAKKAESGHRQHPDNCDNGSGAHPSTFQGGSLLHNQTTLDKLLSNGDELQAIFRGRSFDAILRTLSGCSADEQTFGGHNLNELSYEHGTLQGQIKSQPHDDPNAAGLTNTLAAAPGRQLQPRHQALVRQITPVLEKLLSVPQSDFNTLLRSSTIEALMGASLGSQASLDALMPAHDPQPPTHTPPTQNSGYIVHQLMPSEPLPSSSELNQSYRSLQGPHGPGLGHGGPSNGLYGPPGGGSSGLPSPPPLRAAAGMEALLPALRTMTEPTHSHNGSSVDRKDLHQQMASPPKRYRASFHQDVGGAVGSDLLEPLARMTGLPLLARSAPLPQAPTASPEKGATSAAPDLDAMEQVRTLESEAAKLEHDNALLQQHLEAMMGQADKFQRENTVLKMMLLRQCQSRGLNVGLPQLSASVAQHSAAQLTSDDQAANFAAAVLSQHRGDVMAALSHLLRMASDKMQGTGCWAP